MNLIESAWSWIANTVKSTNSKKKKKEKILIHRDFNQSHFVMYGFKTIALWPMKHGVTFLGCYLSSSVWQQDWLCPQWKTKNVEIQSFCTCKSVESDPTEEIICLESAHTMVTLENLYYLCNLNDCHFLLGLLKYMCLVNVSEVTAFLHSLNQNWTGCVFSVIICSLFVWLSDQCLARLGMHFVKRGLQAWGLCTHEAGTWKLTWTVQGKWMSLDQ